MCIDKVKWITARRCGKQKWHSMIHSGLVQAEKGKVWNSTLPHKMCPRKQTTEPKLLILVSFFSEDTYYTDTSHCIHLLWEVCRSVILWATLYSFKTFKAFRNGNLIWLRSRDKHHEACWF